MPNPPIPFPFTGRTREQAIEALRRVFGSQTEQPTPPSDIVSPRYRPSPTPPKLNFGPMPWYKEDFYKLKEDPNMLLASQLAKRDYPNVWNKLGAVNVGVDMDGPFPPEGTAAYVTPSMGGQAIVNMGYHPSRAWTGPDNVLTALDTLRHELSHTVGLADWTEENKYGQPQYKEQVRDAYDVGTASKELHQDIDLPAAKQAVVGLKKAVR
jgi:hypothetical protein